MDPSSPTSEERNEAQRLAKDAGYPRFVVIVAKSTADIPRLAQLLGKTGKFMVYVAAVTTLVVQLILVPSGLVNIEAPTQQVWYAGRQLVTQADKGEVDPGHWPATNRYYTLGKIDDEPPMRPVNPPYWGHTIIASTGIPPSA